MSALGICATTRFYPGPAELAELGVGAGDWLVLHCYSLAELDHVLSRVPADINILLGANNEMAEVRSDWSGWESAMRQVAQRGSSRIKIVRCGNELDLWHWQPPIGAPDPSLTPLFAANLVRRAYPILHPASIKVSLSSVASGNWQDYIEEMSHLAGAFADYADLHLYVKRLNGVPNNLTWQPAADALNRARELAGRPVISSEAGIKVDDAGGLDWQAQWAAGLANLPTDLVCYFAWSDAVGTPSEQGGQAFGSRGPDGQAKPVWFELQKLFRATGSQPPTNQHAAFQHGFKQIADRHPEIVGSPRENESGPWRHCSLQRTDKGWMVWGNFADGVGDQKGFVADDLTRYVWNGDRLERR